jgi:ribosomal protein S18 acetylase RimI-like enzyme
MSIEFSIATEKDIEQLMGFFKHYGKLSKKRAECYTSHNFKVVAKDGEKIVGVLQWCIKEEPDDGVVEFEEIFVSENYREKGIGSKLLEYSIQSVKNQFRRVGYKPRRIFLFVGKENSAARKLYEKQGFRFIAEVGNLFADNEIETFYCLEL